MIDPTNLPKHYQHILLDAPLTGNVSNLHIIQSSGSLTGRFIFTEPQPAIHWKLDGPYYSVRNCYIKCAHTGIVLD